RLGFGQAGHACSLIRSAMSFFFMRAPSLWVIGECLELDLLEFLARAAGDGAGVVVVRVLRVRVLARGAQVVGEEAGLAVELSPLSGHGAGAPEGEYGHVSRCYEACLPDPLELHLQ